MVEDEEPFVRDEAAAAIAQAGVAAGLEQQSAIDPQAAVYLQHNLLRKVLGSCPLLVLYLAQRLEAINVASSPGLKATMLAAQGALAPLFGGEMECARVLEAAMKLTWQAKDAVEVLVKRRRMRLYEREVDNQHLEPALL